MMKLLKALGFNSECNHRDAFPIYSMYLSFNGRRIIWECYKCGHRYTKDEYMPMDKCFSFEPTSELVVGKKLQKILNVEDCICYRIEKGEIIKNGGYCERHNVTWNKSKHA